MGNYAEKALMDGLKFGWKILDTKQKEIMESVLRIVRSLSDDKILEIGKRENKPRFNPTANKGSLN